MNSMLVYKIADLFSSMIILPLLGFSIIIDLFTNKKGASPTRKLMVLDTSYTFEMIKQRQLYQSVICRDLNGYFEHVWSVHPFATVITPKNPSDICGDIATIPISDRHTIIEGRVGRYSFLKMFPVLNFILSQGRIYFFLNELIRRERICAVRVGDPYYIGIMGLCLSRSNRVPLIVRVGCNYDMAFKNTGKPAMPRLFRKRWIEKLIDRFVLKRADLVAGANEDNLNYAILNGASTKFTTIFRYGNLIHEAHFKEPKERTGGKEVLTELGISNRRFALYIGRLESVKHPDHILRVIALVKDKGYDLAGLLVGDGRMENELKQMMSNHGIENNIFFAGNRDQEWLASIIPHATVVLSPHTGRALSEAALGGVPIVAYDIDWQSEVVKTGETGELVGYQNWTAMTDSVVKLLKDSKYAKRMGTNARNAVLEMMDPVKLNQHERNEYDKLFARYFLE